MEKIKSVKFNFLMNFILMLSNFIFPLVTFPYVSRILLASGNGKIAFASSIANYFGMLASLGIYTYGVRVCASVRDDRDKLSKTVQELIIIHFVVTTISLLLFLISVFTVNKFYLEKELMIINGISLLLNVLGVNWLYSALEKYQYITIRSIFFKIISVVLMFLLVHQQSDYIIYGTITVFAAVGSNVLNFININKFVDLKKKAPYNFRQHIKPILIFFAQSVAISIYTNLDILMLGFMKGDITVGLYSAAIKTKTVLSYLVTSLGTVLLPRLSYFITNDFFDEFKRLIHQATEFVLAISLPLSLFFVIMAKETILLLSGGSYVDATLAMQIIIPTIVFVGFSNITGLQILTPMKKEKIVLVSVLIGSIVDLVFNLIFIPTYGAAGAAMGTLFAEIIVLFVQIFYVKKNLKDNFFSIKKIILITIISGCLAIPLIFIKTCLRLPLFITLSVSGLCYFSLIVLIYLIFNIGGSRAYLSQNMNKK